METDRSFDEIAAELVAVNRRVWLPWISSRLGGPLPKWVGDVIPPALWFWDDQEHELM